jgi:hypothetical protein
VTRQCGFTYSLSKNGHPRLPSFWCARSASKGD